MIIEVTDIAKEHLQKWLDEAENKSLKISVVGYS